MSGFSEKEMLLMIINKLDKMEIKLNETHEKAYHTNGKVKIHTKIIFGIFGIIVTIIGWIISIALK